jgi:hypothetical protein
MADHRRVGAALKQKPAVPTRPLGRAVRRAESSSSSWPYVAALAQAQLFIYFVK